MALLAPQLSPPGNPYPKTPVPAGREQKYQPRTELIITEMTVNKGRPQRALGPLLVHLRPLLLSASSGSLPADVLVTGGRRRLPGWPAEYTRGNLKKNELFYQGKVVDTDPQTALGIGIWKWLLQYLGCVRLRSCHHGLRFQDPLQSHHPY